MKITVQTAAFSRELYKAQGIAVAKTSIPILQNIILEATEDGRVRILVTDLEIFLRTEISGDDVQVHQPGRVAIRAKELYEAVKSLKNPTLTLEREDQEWVLLKSGTVRARLVGTNPDEYPQIPSTDAATFTDIPTDRFMRLMDRVAFSVSKDAARPHLGGAYLHAPKEGEIGLVSTDGHRLSVAAFEFDETIPGEIKTGVIIPRKGLEEIRRSVDQTQAMLGVALLDTSIVFQQGDTTLLVRLIDGSFPSYQQVIPAEKEENKATIDRAMFLDRIKLVALFSNQRTRNLRVQFKDGTCTISAHDPEKGECQEELPINYSGPEVKAGFNFQYLSEVLSILKTDDVTVEITDALKPAVIHEVGEREGERSVFIVMPMRI